MAIYTLVHNGMEIMRCESDNMEPDEMSALRHLNHTRSFSFERLIPDRLPSLGENYSMMEMILAERETLNSKQMHRRAMKSAVRM